MTRTHSITSIYNETKKVEEELTKVLNKQEKLEARLHKTKQVMDAFKKSGKSLHELMVFL